VIPITRTAGGFYHRLPAGRSRNLKSKGIIWVAGRACQAFKLFDLFCQEYGNLTLGELSKRLSRHNYWILWGAK